MGWYLLIVFVLVVAAFYAGYRWGKGVLVKPND